MPFMYRLCDVEEETLPGHFGVHEECVGPFSVWAAGYWGSHAPIVRLSPETCEREILRAHWGVFSPGAGSAKVGVTHAAMQGAAMPDWARAAFLQRRCLVPITAFAGRTGRAHKMFHWYAAAPSRPLVALAAIWAPYQASKFDHGLDLRAGFAVLTATLDPPLKGLPASRTPMVLDTASDFSTWLNGTSADAAGLLKVAQENPYVHIFSGPEEAIPPID